MGNKVIFIFTDGVGIADAVPSNPFLDAEMPFLTGLARGPLTTGHQVSEANFLFRGIDACLSVKGLPQSATGQTALFTGINAPGVIGYHYPAFPNGELIELIREHNILGRVTRSGLRACFANAYTDEYFAMVERGERSHSVTTHCVLSSGLSFKSTQDLLNGKAVYWDITNRNLPSRSSAAVPQISPETAGENLAGLSGENEFVLFETFLTDILGHRHNRDEILPALNLLDRFIGSVAACMEQGTTVIISSDHGNIEDLSTPGHTYNPAILVAIGQYAGRLKDVASIAGLVEPVMGILKG
jgi:2,3-bisphosphoglycerate-independent phosphoglycerate mutase